MSTHVCGWHGLTTVSYTRIFVMLKHVNACYSMTTHITGTADHDFRMLAHVSVISADVGVHFVHVNTCQQMWVYIFACYRQETVSTSRGFTKHHTSSPDDRSLQVEHHMVQTDERLSVTSTHVTA